MPKHDLGGSDPIATAVTHLGEAMKLLTLECHRAPADAPGDERLKWEAVEDFTLAEELERIDRALGPKGKSVFASIGDSVRRAYVEIKAAHDALKGDQA